MWMVKGQIRILMVDEPMIMNNSIKNKDAVKLAQVTETFL